LEEKLDFHIDFVNDPHISKNSNIFSAVEAKISKVVEKILTDCLL
jgi:hypothetical protein